MGIKGNQSLYDDHEDTDNKTYTVDSLDENNKEDASISGADAPNPIRGKDPNPVVGYTMLWEDGVSSVGRSSLASTNTNTTGVPVSVRIPSTVGSLENMQAGGVGVSLSNNITNSGMSNGGSGSAGSGSGVVVGNNGRVCVKEEVHRYSGIPVGPPMSLGQSNSNRPTVTTETKRSHAGVSHDYSFNKVPSRGNSITTNSTNNKRSSVYTPSASNRQSSEASSMMGRNPDDINYDLPPVSRRHNDRSPPPELRTSVTSDHRPKSTLNSSQSIRPNDNRNAQTSDKTEATEPKDREEKKPLDKLGTPVYQIEVRFIVYKGLRFCGGVRVLLNCPEESAFLQLITLQDEVFVTYDINNICFLEPRSAAGVSFCGVPFNQKPDNEDNPETDYSATEPTDNAERKRQRCRERKRGTSVIDHAEVVFCTPEQTMRFKTVIDTLLCAVSCEDPNVPPQSLSEMGGAIPAPRPERTEGVPFGDGSTVNKNRSQFEPSNVIYPQSVKQHEPIGDQYSSLAKNKYSMIQSFDPCPRGPVSTSMCLPCDLGDPYQLNPDEGRVVFCTPACLKVCCRNGEKMVYKGKLKIVQGTGGIGFVIRIESTDGTTLYCHSLRRDLILYETNDVQYGFCYSTVVCTAGRTSMETFVVAFPSSYQCDQFKHAINTCKEILGMTSVQSLINVNRT